MSSLCMGVWVCLPGLGRSCLDFVVDCFCMIFVACLEFFVGVLCLQCGEDWVTGFFQFDLILFHLNCRILADSVLELCQSTVLVLWQSGVVPQWWKSEVISH